MHFRRVMQTRAPTFAKVNIKFHVLRLIPFIQRAQNTRVYSVHAINAGSLIKHENDARIIN